MARHFEFEQISSRCALLLAVFAIAACGGVDHGRPEANASTHVDAGVDPDTECAATAGLTLQRITDFEPPPGANPNLKPPPATCDVALDPTKSPCMYYNFDTEQSPHVCGSSMPSLASCVQTDGKPMPNSFCMFSSFPSAGPNIVVSQILDVHEEPSSRCGVSKYAFHLAGTNIAACYDPTTKKQGWGITLQITFNVSPQNSGVSLQEFDASSWDGISFWVRRGTGSSSAAILANIQDHYTSNTSGCGALASLEPADPKQPPPPDAQKCDPFGVGVGLTPDWRFVKVPFANAKQKGFGVPSPLGQVEASALDGMQFVLQPGDWDVWIDDIAFYREPQ